MKKLVLALTAVAAFTGSALAADLAARPYTKAPAPAVAVYNWTGFYIFGGVGGGMWDAEHLSPGVTATGTAPQHRSDARAAMAGSERSAPATTGSSTRVGSSASSPTASSAA